MAAFYDIHGNLPALEAVLQCIRQEKVDLIVVGGDVVPGPMPRETIDFLLSLDIPIQFISDEAAKDGGTPSRDGAPQRVMGHPKA